MIDYRGRTAATEADFQRLVALYAESFRKWRATRPIRATQDVETAFGVWWRLKGPTDFRRTEDALAFRQEVLAELNAGVSDAG